MNRLCIIFISMCVTTAVLPLNYQWGNSNGTVSWNGNVVGGSAAGLISDSNQVAFHSQTLPITPDGGTTAVQWGIFTPLPTDTLTIVDKVKIQGDVEIRFNGSLPVGEYEVFNINIGLPPIDNVPVNNNPVTIGAYNDNATVEADGAQLIFNPAQGKVIVVNVYADISFVSADAKVGNDPNDPESPGAALPLHVTFRGKGSTVFRLPSGRTVYFGPPNPGHGAEGNIVADTPLSTRGVQVRVYMEQGSIDAFGDGENVVPQSQLVFEKWSYAADNVNTSQNLALHTWITVGQLSSISYISDNYIGMSEVWNDTTANGLLDVGETTFESGYGSIAFDPSSAGTGRLILQIMRGQLPSGNDYTDGGVNVYGALLAPTVWGSTRAKASIFNADFRTGVYYNQRAGISALFRVTDDVSYNETYTNHNAWISRPLSARRGLVVINHNNSIPHFTNNYDNADRIDNSLWAQFNDYEPGFIVGINGIIEVRPHMFLDYIANNDNKAISAHNANLTFYTSDLVKKHNPAALYADGLPTFTKRSKQEVDRFGVPISDLLYVGNSPSFGAHAVISLQGNAGLYVRAAAAYNENALTRILFTQPATRSTYFLQPLPGDNTQVITVALGIGQYDGISVPVLDDIGAPVMQAIDRDGCHAFDVEATCTIASQAGPSGEVAAGFFNVPSVEIDYAGREVGYTNFDEWSMWQVWYASAGPNYAPTTVTSPSGATYDFAGSTPLVLGQSPVTSRPLDVNRYYAVYDISTVCLNGNLVFDSATWLNNDVTRNLVTPGIIPQPFSPAKPHVVGGELAGIRQDLYPPLIKLYDSTVACHESLIMSGVALTVHERTGAAPADAHNTSSIVFFNRGRDFDVSGYGRVLQLGTQANVTADGSTTSLLMSSAYLDVYRAAPTVGASLEEPTTIQCTLRSQGEVTVSDSEKALHLLYLANGSQIRLGWPTLEGDSGYLPATIDGVILDQLQEIDPSNKLNFRFAPYGSGIATLQFNGGPFCIGAGDSVEALPPDVPVPGAEVDGVVYVNYGGRLSVFGSTDLYIDTVVARLKASTILATGSIVSPRDQVYLLSNGVIQDYDIDFASDKNTTGDFINNVSMNIDTSVYVFDVPQIQETPDASSGK